MGQQPTEKKHLSQTHHVHTSLCRARVPPARRIRRRSRQKRRRDCSLETRSRRTRGDEPGETARESSRGEKCHGEQTHLDGSTQSVAKQKRTLEFDEGEIDESGGYFGGEGRADCGERRADCVFEE